ncbi:MAG: hypothetical protein Q8L60_17215 [Gammaproteobacteria bacterium]|nr:hypothetical protein [Gammaproteobacteria bacterium]MDP2140645.1 hypothetical protein [Gammaproteobacteria bacterium]MDP2347417.1 hypothetical protein [Gammaproteobacteria bacterium]
MRILLLVLSLPLAILPHYSFSADITMEECNARVAEMNATLPMELDNITSWMQTTCVEQSDGGIQLVYDNDVKDGNSITQAELDAVLPSVLMSWCFGPDLFPLIQVVDAVNYQYNFENGQHIGELNFSYADCVAEI